MAMTKRYYFCWEKNSCGIWGPVVYHGEAPKPEKTSKDDAPSRTAVIELDPKFIDGNDSPNFKRITDAYPGPKAAAGFTRVGS